MRARLGGLARRIALTRRLDVAFALLANPVHRGRRGVNVVIAEYYGMLVGRRFDDDEAAAAHYFRVGWKLGVIPTPFLHVSAVRFSTAASLLLRNQLARIGRGGEPRGRWIGAPARLLSEVRIAEFLGAHGGWLAELTRRVRADPRSVTLRLGVHEVRTDAYLQSCRELTDAAATVVGSELIDLALYEQQVGGYRFLSRYAALDDFVARGELDGRTVHPFFESEWYEERDRSQVRRGRPVCQLLDFVARGELGQASPHFWGKKYAESLVGAQPASLLADFTARVAPTALTPSSEGVVPIARRDAERVMRERVDAYHAGLEMLVATGPVLSRHRRSSAAAALDGTCLVVIDERHLRSGPAVAALRGAVGQSLRGARYVVVESDDVPRSAALEELCQQTLALDIVTRTPGETLAGATLRLVAEASPEAWTMWAPGQTWHTSFLAAAVGALRAHRDVAAAAVVGESTPQPWLRTSDALWLPDLDGAGVVFRARGDHAALPDASMDVGLAWRLLIDIAASGRCAVIAAPLVRATRAPEVSDHDRRAGANAARASTLVRFTAAQERGTTLVIPTFQDWRMTVTAVARALEDPGVSDLHVIVVDNGSRRPVAGILASVFAADDRVLVHRVPVNTDFAVGSNIGASLARTSRVVFLNNDTAPLPGWLAPLVAALDDPEVCGVQPLLLYGDRTVQTAGTIFLGGMSMPLHLFTDVHPSDVGEHLDAYAFSALTAACLAVRTADLAAIGGFDAHYVNGMEDVDLCLRLAEHTRGTFRVRTRSRVVHFESRTAGRYAHQWSNRAWFAERWRHMLTGGMDDRAVFDQGPIELVNVKWRRHPFSPLWTPELTLRLRPRPEIDVSESAPRLRWAIKSSATGDIAGDTWGDTFYSDALADALRALGQHVVVDRASSHGRDTSEWDDVTLALRGLARYLPQPGAVNLLWVISHPDLVTRYELGSGFDKIYSAGAVWAQTVRERWGVEVDVLLQATDVRKFRPDAAGGARRDGILFVGRTRGVSRPIVTDVIAAGGTPDVYGDDGWEQFIDPRFVRGSGIANDDVPAAYAGARIVLNDHWRDMAEAGFFSNRLFDAAATGARIVSDAVPGMAEVFGEQVRTYESIDELRALIAPDAEGWPPAAELAAASARIAQRHSFDARAAALLADALEIRRHRRN